MPTDIPTLHALRDAFTYDPDTGAIRTNARIAGDTSIPAGLDPVVARGAKNSRLYPIVRLDGRDVHAARVAFAHVRQEAPHALPYPKDGDPFNLRWENWEPQGGPGRPKGSSDNNSRKALLARIDNLQRQVRALQDATLRPKSTETAPAAPPRAPEPAPLSPPLARAAWSAAATLRSAITYLVSLRRFTTIDENAVIALNKSATALETALKAEEARHGQG